MIRSYVFSEGKVVGQNLEVDALRLIRADKGLHIWVDLFEPTPEEVKSIMEDLFAFHPLAIEDCLNVSQFPKIEDYEDYLFLVIHAVDFSREDQFKTTELDLFLGKEFLVTYHTAPLRAINTVADRAEKGTLQAPKAMDRLMHVVLDSVTNNYDPVLADLRDEVQALEDSAFSTDYEKNMINEFLFVKKEIASLSRIVRPQREVIHRLAHGEFKIIRPHMLPYYRDIHDSLRRIEDVAQSYSDQLYLSLDVFLNHASNKTNDAIKVLTILTAITTPLTLIGTWYGMNFDGMPELSSPYGYWTAMGATVLLTVALMAYLKIKKFL